MTSNLYVALFCLFSSGFCLGVGLFATSWSAIMFAVVNFVLFVLNFSIARRNNV